MAREHAIDLTRVQGTGREGRVSKQDVLRKSRGTKVFAHPLVGRLTLDYDMLTLSEDDQQLVVYTAPAGSPDQASLELLATIAIST